MKTKTSSILAATFAAALATVASAQINPALPTGINAFVAPSAFNAASYAATLNQFYLDSSGNVPLPNLGGFTSTPPPVSFLAGGGTVKAIFLGETAASLNDFGYIRYNPATPDFTNPANYVALSTDIDNNTNGLASGYETLVHYNGGTKVDFWLNNPAPFNPGQGGAYFSFILDGSTTTSFTTPNDLTLHIKYATYNVLTEYWNGSAFVQGLVPTLVVAFEDLSALPGSGNNAPTPADGDYTDFIFAFQFLPNQAVPEPSTYGLMGAAALLGLVGYRRFKASKKAA